MNRLKISEYEVIEKQEIKTKGILKKTVSKNNIKKHVRFKIEEENRYNLRPRRNSKEDDKNKQLNQFKKSLFLILSQNL